MPKKAKELSALAVSKLKAEGRHAVGGADGLYLRIAGESRAWVLCVALGTRTNRSGKEVVRRLNMGLGPFPEVSLAEAREKARELRKQVREGIDPLQEKREAKARDAKQAAKSKTFAECALAFIEDIRSNTCRSKLNKRKELKMDNQSYFKDIDREIKKLGCVSTLVILESKRIACEVFRDAEFYPSVLQVLTHLTAQQLNISDVQEHYAQDEVRRRVNREIDAAIAAQRK